MGYKIKSKIWIESNGQILLGEGRVSLLKAIDETGSLNKAAKQLKMSYKKAWSLVDMMNKRSEYPITSATVGGKGGGGVQLTSYGKTLIDTFETINQNCWNFLDCQMNESKFQ